MKQTQSTKEQIKAAGRKQYAEMKQAKQRLEYLRGELRAERISLDGLHELQSLKAHIDPDDVELLEAAGVPEKRLDFYDL
jgi:hypothetical protein